MHFGPRAISKRTFWALGFAFAISAFLLPLAALPAKDKHHVLSSDSKLTLRVYNYAGLSPSSLVLSEEVATSIFQRVGIEPVWVDCPTSKRNAVAYQSCDSPMGPADFIVRILPRHMADKVRHSQDSLGFAQICPDSEPACELNLFYHRIDELAAKGYRADRILGYAIAHEVAHILIGPIHSNDGIMRASWSSSDLNHISLGLQVNFSSIQSTQLRLALLRRSVPQETTAQASLVAP